MKPFILLLLFISCTNDNKQKPAIVIPIDSTVILRADTCTEVNIQKSPEGKHLIFEVNTRKKDTVIIKNQSK